MPTLSRKARHDSRRPQRAGADLPGIDGGAGAAAVAAERAAPPAAGAGRLPACAALRHVLLRIRRPLGDAFTEVSTLLEPHGTLPHFVAVTRRFPARGAKAKTDSPFRMRIALLHYT